MVSSPILDAFNISVSAINVTPKGTIYLADSKRTFGKVTLTKDSHVKLTVGEVGHGTPVVKVGYEV